VSQQELNLFQFAAGSVAESGTRPPEIVRREVGDLQFLRVCLHNMPDDFFRHPIAPCVPRATHAPEQFPIGNIGCREPSIEEPFHPIGNWDGSNVTGFSNEVHDGPMVLASLKVIESEIGQFAPSKTTP
jgi:hypothetical protein